MRAIRSILLGLLILVVAVSIGAVGCSKKPRASTDVTTTTPVTPPSEDQPPTNDSPDVEPTTPMELSDVFFDYDKSNLRDDARRTLDQDGKYLVDNSSTRVLLEGHCDERGSVEYNLALGERRAQSVRNYLVQFGVDASRLSTISYGEERPFAQGHGEEAWGQNRRVHFVKQ
jgi:peptidoglycan-associated lipoprotein